jgi:hypothetical protein
MIGRKPSMWVFFAEGRTGVRQLQQGRCRKKRKIHHAAAAPPMAAKAGHAARQKSLPIYHLFTDQLFTD